MQATHPCHLCGADSPFVHVDEIPDRVYCSRCSGCDLGISAEMLSGAPDLLCDGCWAEWHGAGDEVRDVVRSRLTSN